MYSDVFAFFALGTTGPFGDVCESANPNSSSSSEMMRCTPLFALLYLLVVCPAAARSSLRSGRYSHDGTHADLGGDRVEYEAS